VSFRAVFIALVIGTALLVAADTINWYRPRIVSEQPTAELVRASGKCAECHANLQYLVLLAFLGLWVLDRHVPASDAQRRSDAPSLALQQTDS
jgi:hydroxylamine dehydrogenase